MVQFCLYWSYGFWNLEFGIRNLVFGIWNLIWILWIAAFWYLVLGIWFLVEEEEENSLMRSLWRDQRRFAVFTFLGCLFLVFGFGIWVLVSGQKLEKNSLMKRGRRDHRGTMQFSPLWVACF